MECSRVACHSEVRDKQGTFERESVPYGARAPPKIYFRRVWSVDLLGILGLRPVGNRQTDKSKTIGKTKQPKETKACSTKHSKNHWKNQKKPKKPRTPDQSTGMIIWTNRHMPICFAGSLVFLVFFGFSNGFDYVLWGLLWFLLVVWFSLHFSNWEEPQRNQSEPVLALTGSSVGRLNKKKVIFLIGRSHREASQNQHWLWLPPLWLLPTRKSDFPYWQEPQRSQSEPVLVRAG